MSTGRLEAFSDGVIAIIITIMVLELKVPQGSTLSALIPFCPVFMSYLLSFIFVGIYWNNHHHLMHAAENVSGAILWANLHLLFWLSLIPFGTAWMGENKFSGAPVAIYGVLLLLSSIAYFILVRALLAKHGPSSKLAQAIGSDFKGKISTLMYAVAIPLAFYQASVSIALYIGVAIIWLVPDRRIEKVLN